MEEGSLAPIDYNRFAGICIGMSFAEASASGTLAIEGAAECPWLAPVVEDDDLMYYVSILSDVETPGESIQFFLMRYYNDPATAVALEMAGTAEGIRIGSTEAELLAAYAGMTSESYTDDAGIDHDVYVSAGPDGNNYVFDMIDGRVGGMAWGDISTIPGHVCAL